MVQERGRYVWGRVRRGTRAYAFRRGFCDPMAVYIP